MAWIIDQEIEKIVKEGARRAEKVISENLNLLEKLAEALLEEEVLDNKRVEQILASAGGPVEK
jgi:cell division protease FtsH